VRFAHHLNAPQPARRQKTPNTVTHEQLSIS